MMATYAAGYRAVTEVASWVAAQPGDWDPNSGKDPEWGKAAPAGLLIWLFLGVMLFLLIKNMNKHLRKARANLGGDGAIDLDIAGVAATEPTDAEADGAEAEAGADSEVGTAAGPVAEASADQGEAR